MTDQEKDRKVVALVAEYGPMRSVALAFDAWFVLGCLLQWVGLFLYYAKVEFAWVSCAAGKFLVARSMFGMFEKFDILREIANEIRALVGAKEPEPGQKVEPGDRLFRHDRKDINSLARQIFDVAFMVVSAIVGILVIGSHFLN